MQVLLTATTTPVTSNITIFTSITTRYHLSKTHIVMSYLRGLICILQQTFDGYTVIRQLGLTEVL